jgi:hypothetical protein
VDEIGAVLPQGDGVPPRAEIGLQVRHRTSVGRVEKAKAHDRGSTGDGLARFEIHFDPDAAGGLHETSVFDARRGLRSGRLPGRDVARRHVPFEDLRRPAGREEIAEERVPSRPGQHGLHRQRPVVRRHRMEVREVLEVAADDEEMKELLVDDLEFRDRLARRGMEDAKPEAHRLPRSNLRRFRRELEAIR